MKRTVLVDAEGWTLYEFNEHVSDEDCLAYLIPRWHVPANHVVNMSLQHDANSIPPQTWISIHDHTTDKIEVVFIKDREDEDDHQE